MCLSSAMTIRRGDLRGDIWAIMKWTRVIFGGLVDRGGALGKA